MPVQHTKRWSCCQQCIILQQQICLATLHMLQYLSIESGCLKYMFANLKLNKEYFHTFDKLREYTHIVTLQWVCYLAIKKKHKLRAKHFLYKIRVTSMIFWNFLLCVFSGWYWSISRGGKLLLPLAKYPGSYRQLKLYTAEYFLLWAWFITYVSGCIAYVEHKWKPCAWSSSKPQEASVVWLLT